MAVGLSFLDEPHSCHECDPSRRPEDDTPGRFYEIGGERFTCPRIGLGPEVFEMVAHFNDWDNGHTPVTTGRAPWLTGPFIDAMHAVRNAVNDCNAEARARARK